MVPSDRLSTPRYSIPFRVTFRRIDQPSFGEQFAKAIDVSTTGVYFTTNQALGIGETIELRLYIPRQLPGITGKSRRFVGRVTRIDSRGTVPAESGVGVHLLYWERDQVNFLQ